MYHQPDGKKAAVEEEESMGRLKNDEMEIEKEIEMEVDAGVPQAESAEMKSRKRKVLRGESEETQDCVYEALSISPEEAEELAFVPSAVSEPRGAIYFCDNRCSERARTVNLCQQCCKERQVQQGEPRLNSWQRRAVVEMKAHRGRN